MYVSYWHIAYVASVLGEGPSSAHIAPLLIDGLMILSSQIRAADKRKGLRPRVWATVVLLGSMGATIAANGSSAYLQGHGYGGMIMACLFAFAIIAGGEILSTHGKPRKPSRDKVTIKVLRAEVSALKAAAKATETTTRTRKTASKTPESPVPVNGSVFVAA
jgi:hypothetical protein